MSQTYEVELTGVEIHRLLKLVVLKTNYAGSRGWKRLKEKLTASDSWASDFEFKYDCHDQVEGAMFDRPPTED